MQNIVRHEARGARRGLPDIRGRLFAVGEDQRGLLIAEPHLAINHRKRGAILVIHRQNEFRPFNARYRSTGDDPDATGFVAMKKRDDAPNEMQSRLCARFVRRKDFEFGRCAERNDAFIGPPQSHAAVGPGAQPVKGIKNLVRAGKHPRFCARRRDFHCALQFDDPDLVGAPYRYRSLRKNRTGTNCPKERDCANDRSPNEFSVRIQCAFW